MIDDVGGLRPTLSNRSRQVATSANDSVKGHRERLRQRFLAGELASRTDEVALELLLTFAISRRDVKPLAKALLSRFGSIENVLAADAETLREVEGVKTTASALLKVVDHLRRQSQTLKSVDKVQERPRERTIQPQFPGEQVSPTAFPIGAGGKLSKPLKLRHGTGLFGKAALREAIQLVPSLPDSSSLDDVREYLRKNLHYNAEETRKRYAAYITRRLFPDGLADPALRAFGRDERFALELKEVCFYRFCKAEPLMQDVLTDVFLPALGMGRIQRERIVSYLHNLFPQSKSVQDCTQAIVDALMAGGIATVDRNQISFSARPVRPAAFAFVLHSEFPEPGIYEVAKAESNRLLRCLLWTPDRILDALYELRNLGVISKISEIDSVRLFTLKFDLAGGVNHLLKQSKAP